MQPLLRMGLRNQPLRLGMSEQLQAPIVPLYQQVRALAAADGWFALYDPSNPNEVTLRTVDDDDFITALGDGLAVQPDAVRATQSVQPYHWKNHFGVGIDAVGFSSHADQAGTSYLQTTGFTQTLTSPSFLMVMAQYAGPLPVADPLFVIDGRSPTIASNRSLYVSAVTGNWTVRGTAGSTNTDIDTGVPVDWEAHLFGIAWNGASTKVYIDNILVATGDVGVSTQTGFTIGNQRVTATVLRQWKGAIGPALSFNGSLSDAKRDRMADLFLSRMRKSIMMRNFWTGAGD